MKKDLMDLYISNYASLRDRLPENVFVFNEADGLFKDRLISLFEIIGAGRVFIVSGLPDEAFSFDFLNEAGISFDVFKGFSPNPKIEEIESGIDKFNQYCADVIVGFGGGSAIDTAKCIRKFCVRDRVPMIAIPTTAGTGSEATRFAVYYKDGVKQSLDDEDVRPDYVMLCGGFLKTLPIYQRKCTFLDAFCQAAESACSRRRTALSIGNSFTALSAMCPFMDEYLKDGGPEAFSGEIPENIPDMFTYYLLCSYFAGRAINITRTTAPHAMSYKLSELKRIPHGHAVALTFAFNFEEIFKAEKQVLSADKVDDLPVILDKIAEVSFKTSAAKFPDAFRSFLADIGIEEPMISADEAEKMALAVNVDRLSNNAVKLTNEKIKEFYLRLGRDA